MPPLPAAPVIRRTEEEHRNFLVGMKVLGIGNWKTISQVYVPSRSAPQLASHAQKVRGAQGARRRRKGIAHGGCWCIGQRIIGCA